MTHALIAYAVCTALAWRYDWLSPAYVTVGMVGAFIPDMRKLVLVVPDAVVEPALGIPFSWGGIHTLGGVVAGVAIGVVLVEEGERRRVGALLALGAATHLVADTLLLTPTVRSYAVLWPLTRWHPPTPGLYLRTEVWPMVVAALVAAVVWLMVRQVESAGA